MITAMHVDGQRFFHAYEFLHPFNTSAHVRGSVKAVSPKFVKRQVQAYKNISNDTE